MARGVIYYVTKDVHAEVNYAESNYYDRLDVMGVDYVKDQSREQSAEPLRCLKDNLYKLGAVIGQGHDNGDYAFSFRFESAEQAKRSYFLPRFQEFKRQADALTLDMVIKTSPSFDHILDNEYGDIVVLEDKSAMTNTTLDGFIRHMESGVTYYVYKRVHLVH